MAAPMLGNGTIFRITANVGTNFFTLTTLLVV